jgi:hypothetical protein
MKKQAAPTALKPFLLKVCIPGLTEHTTYFSIQHIRRFLEERTMHSNSKTLVGYLHDLTAAGIIYSAGRGWYSRLATRFVLDTTSIKQLADEVAKAFPLVTFSCWSTAQVQAAMHHLFGKFAVFVMVEPDAMETVWEYLRDSGMDAWLNPRGKEAERFTLRERTVVVRRESSKTRSKDPLAPIEKLLVDLYFEVRDLNLMAMEDYHAMLTNLAGTQRITMALLASYAAERKLTLDDILGKENQLIPLNRNRRN